MTLYAIKPQFQALLRPLAHKLANRGITANQVTLTAAGGSVVLGFLLYLFAHIPQLFLLLPLWMLIRMALNAIDGMLAREFDQQTVLGAYLNELGDIVSDTALLLPFAALAPFTGMGVGLVIFLAVLSEFAGVMGLTIGASRRYDGPLGKSDRAFIFGALGLWVGLYGTMPDWLYWLMPFLSAMLMLTIYNRIKNALQETTIHPTIKP